MPQKTVPKGDDAPVAESARRRLVRAAILETSADVFLQKGYGVATLGDIADALQVTRAALYYYFKNKEEILSALVEDVTTTAADRMESQAPKANHAKTLHSTIYDMSLWFIEKRKYFKIVERSEAQLCPAVAQRNAEGKKRVFTILRDQIAAGVAAGEFRPVPESVTAFALIGMVNWSASWVTEEEAQAPQRIALTFAELAINAVTRIDHADRIEESPLQTVRRLEVELGRLAERISEP